ncbi:hypothetical protein Tco_1490273, partial [Tanacetum coccineum]
NARKFKKPASSLRKRTLVTVEEEDPKPDTPGVSVSKKKAPATTDKSKGIHLLSEAALLEEAQVKKVLKRSQRETTMHQAGGSGDGDGFQPEVHDEPKGKSIDTHNGTGLKPGVLDVSKADSSKSEYESWGDSGDEANVQEINDDEEESDNEFVHTPEDYVPTDDETNNETKDVDEEEYDRIDKELYGDVNIRVLDVVQDDKGEKDADMTNVAHVQYVEQITTTAPVIQNATTEVPPLSSSHSVSSTYTNTFLNLENLHSTKTEVVSMMDINVQYEVSRTLPLLTIPISVILEHTVFPSTETRLISSSNNHYFILLSLFLLFNNQYQSQHQQTQMEHARKQQVPKDTISSSNTITLEEFDQKTTLFKIMTKSKSFNKSPKHKALYHALMESILKVEDAMDKDVADELKKRKPDNDDKDIDRTTG